jgi:hypothetical protein
VCVFFTHFAHGTAGAARIRHSLLPRFEGVGTRPGRYRAAGTRRHIQL